MGKEQVVCDTDVIIDYWNANNQRHKFTQRILESLIGLDNVIISAMTKMELLVGANNKEDLKTIDKKLHRLNISLIDERVSSIALQLLQDYNLSHGLAIPDALIAATALNANLRLFTHNIKDYKFITQLSIYTE
ncbi:type II toxin-antitoxin system VapC family toxin [Mucilaginibacter terrae]|uniref:type II toxin-antitoxin system VapC family toxin n=1 Tax=Mucilaginibacter terrae TaxID=1955052 RepID=UPI0036352D72